MPDSTQNPTPDSEINAVLGELLSGIKTILGDGLVGLYLYGSLASGDFNPQTSDIDFLAVTAGEIPNEAIPALEAMHMRLWAGCEQPDCLQTGSSKWAAKLEGTYLPQAALRRYDPNDPPRPTVNEGHFYLARQGNDWVIQRHILREQGVAVLGPPLQGLIDPVLPDELREAVRGVLQEWWAPMLQDPVRLQSDEYQAYAVLSMCRALYTLQYGKIVSKQAAALWAVETLEEQWSGMIKQAFAWRPGVQMDRLNETMDFIRLTIQRSSEVNLIFPCLS